VAAGSNVLVHLKLAPVIARVMSGTAHLHDDVETWLAREVAVGSFLAERGLAVAPAVTPARSAGSATCATGWTCSSLNLQASQSERGMGCAPASTS
jgi:hypothetical protein